MKQELTGLKALIDEVKAYVDEKLGGGEIGDYIVETYEDDDGNWYRLWSSGYCEQCVNYSSDEEWSSSFSWNGRTLNLLIPYKNNKYHISSGAKTDNSSYYSDSNSLSRRFGFAGMNAYLVGTKTTTGLTIQSYFPSTTKFEGYI